MIRFACPNCRKVLKAPPDKGGLKTSCPACKTPVQVPVADTPPPSAPAHPALPVARPVAPPVAVPVVAVKMYPPRAEPAATEYRGWAGLASALRGEDGGARPLDLTGPVLAEVRKALDGYAATVPHHAAAGFGTKAAVTSAAEWCVYTANMRGIMESRVMGSGEAPHAGWRLPATTLDPTALDPWDYRYPPHLGAVGRTENVIPATQVAHDCGGCQGQGAVPCGACRGNKVATCTACSGGGRVACGRCGGRRLVRVRTGTVVRDVRCHCDAGYAHGTGRQVPCFRCNGRGTISESEDDYGDVPCPCANGYVSCSACGGGGRTRCAGCTGSGQTACGHCRGNKKVVRFATVSRSFEPLAPRSATAAGAGSEPAVADALARRPGHHPLARLVTADPMDSAAFGSDGLEGTVRSLIDSARTAGTPDRRLGAVEVTVVRATAVRVEYDYAGRRFVAWLLGREKAVHAPTSPVTDAVAATLRRATKDWNQSRQKEAVAQVREAMAMGERDEFCRAALDAGRADLPTELWQAATNPGFFGAVGKLFGKLFG